MTSFTKSVPVKPIHLVLVILGVAIAAHQFFYTDLLNQALPDPAVEPLAIKTPVIKTMSLEDIELAKAEQALASAQRALQPSQVSTESAPIKTGTPPRPWQTGNEAAVSLPVPQGVVTYEPVSVDMESPTYPMPGEQLTLAMPGGGEYVVNVEKGIENPNGDYSWRGHLDGHGTDYPVVMTYGANSVFATVTTPNGSYTMESVNGNGWVYKNPSEFELSAPGKNDYLEIPHEHNHP